MKLLLGLHMQVQVPQSTAHTGNYTIPMSTGQAILFFKTQILLLLFRMAYLKLENQVLTGIV
jgi:hypothetical protein